MSCAGSRRVADVEVLAERRERGHRDLYAEGIRWHVRGLIDTGQFAFIHAVHVHELADERVIAAAVMETESHGPHPGGAGFVVGAAVLRGPEPPHHVPVRFLRIWHVRLPHGYALLVPVPFL